MDTWTVATAQSKFSEVIDRALNEGPQSITRNGRDAVVVVSAAEWERKTCRTSNLAEFFAQSPLREAELGLDRAEDGPRDLDL